MVFILQVKIFFILNMLMRFLQYSLSEVVFIEKVVLDQEVLKFEMLFFFVNFVEEVYLEIYNDICYLYVNKLVSIFQFNVNLIMQFLNFYKFYKDKFIVIVGQDCCFYNVGDNLQ